LLLSARVSLYILRPPFPAFRAVTEISAVFTLIGPPWIVHRLGSHAGTRMSRDQSWRRNDSAVPGLSSWSVPRNLNASWGSVPSPRAVTARSRQMSGRVLVEASIQPFGRSPTRPRDALGETSSLRHVIRIPSRAYPQSTRRKRGAVL
jgi:hypothetical protein